jgi:hypothetical protein
VPRSAALVRRQNGLRLFTQRPRLIKLGTDAFGALVQHAAQHRRNLEVDQEPDEQQKGQQHDEIGVAQREERTRGRKGRAGGKGEQNCQLFHRFTLSAGR